MIALVQNKDLSSDYYLQEFEQNYALKFVFTLHFYATNVHII